MKIKIRLRNKKPVTYSLPFDVINRVEEGALKLGISKSSFVSMILKKCLENYPEYMEKGYEREREKAKRKTPDER
ncbi:MAG TPA: hypothetical protein EYP11_06215 [Aquificaceae bacterium]|nr:hypothetical protein [Aquificaceae bacterium]